MIEKLRGHKVAALAGLATVLSVLGISGLAGAVAYNPTSALTGFANSFGTQVGPIVVAVALAMAGIVILFWGVHFIFSFIRSRRS